MTPVLDGARFLSETLASVREQDYPRIERTSFVPPQSAFVRSRLVLEEGHFVAEWRRACRKRKVGFLRLLLHEVVVASLRRRLGLPP